MKFNRLRITNIGAFYGNYDFDFYTSDKTKNVVLIGGKNGSGKTTILEAIRLALFGTFAFGLKNESNVYFEKIESRLNNIAKKSNAPFYQVILDIEIVEDLKKNEYTLRRSWTRNRGVMKEKFSVLKNGQLLNDRDLEIFQTKLREETPPQLLEFCLFDGERISQIVSNETLSSYFKQTAKVMFNLDLFENLEADLSNYIKQDHIYSSLSNEEKKLIQVEHEIKTIQTHIAQLIDEIETLDIQLDEKNAILSELNRQYEVHGGLKKAQRDSLIKEMNEIDHHRLMMMEKNKELITTLLPFVLVRDLLTDVVIQMQKESTLEVKNNVRSMISPEDIEKEIASLEELKSLSNNNHSSIASRIYDRILELLTFDCGKVIHNASSQQRAEIERLVIQLNEFEPEKMLNDFKKNTAMIKKIQSIRKKIEENDSTSDLKSLLDEIQKVKSQMILLVKAKETHEEHLKNAHEALQTKEQEFQTQKSKVIQARKARNIFSIATRILEVSSLFRERQMKKKIQQVELETARMLQLVFRKELFVTRVKIDPNSFQIKIFDSAQDEINIENLSAGEKQILLLSTVWAMATCSRRRLPFVFDTLLGRLDQTHKKRILSEFIPRCGEQVIILSTDSEINEEQYYIIKDFVSKTYTIDFNSNKSTVDVFTSYFNVEHEIKEYNYEFSS
jgi:DNA sulfur modification protein DndD